MRRTLTLTLALAFSGWLPTPSHAQRGGASADSGFDELRPYGTRSSATRQADRPYARSSEAPAPPFESPSRLPVRRTVGSFYPTMRAGQSRNRNVVDTRSLCNPGRRALLQQQR